MQKVAVITAGGSGMGAAAARRLAADGFAVAILSSSGKGEALGAELGGVGVTGSNQNNDDVQRVVDAAMAKFGRIDVLVNSAGHGPRAALLDITDEGWHQGIEIYFLSAVRPIRAVTPIFEAQGTGGSIINITLSRRLNPIRPSRPLAWRGRVWRRLQSFTPINMHRKAFGSTMSCLGLSTRCPRKRSSARGFRWGAMAMCPRLRVRSVSSPRMRRAISPDRICGWMAGSRARFEAGG